MNFFHDMAHNPFLWTGLLAGWLASIACGVVGPHVITRRIVFLAGAIAHIALGGVGASIFLRHRFPETFGWLDPSVGAGIVAVAAAVALAAVHQRVAERMDTLIGALWATGMAVGILLVKFTDDYTGELMGFLFGNIATVSTAQVWGMLWLNVAILGIAALYHKRFLAVCLDAQQARLQGVNEMHTEIVLLVLVALTVSLLISVGGLILVIALLTLPAAAAGHHTRRMGAMMGASMLLCVAVTTLPRVAVYGTRVSPESAIVLAAGAIYLASVLYRHFRPRAA